MIDAKVTGIPDYSEALRSIPSKLRRRALLNSLKKGGRVVQAGARSRTPVLRNALRAPYRKPGTLKKAIAVRTSKDARRAGDVGVFVNVRPLKASQRSAKNPNDPFYGRFVQWGTGKMRGFHFLEAGIARLGEALRIIEQDLGPQIQRLDTSPKDPL